MFSFMTNIQFYDMSKIIYFTNKTIRKATSVILACPPRFATCPTSRSEARVGNLSEKRRILDKSAVSLADKPE
jgi:hypothetical protein